MCWVPNLANAAISWQRLFGTNGLAIAPVTGQPRRRGLRGRGRQRRSDGLAAPLRAHAKERAPKLFDLGLEMGDWRFGARRSLLNMRQNGLNPVRPRFALTPCRPLGEDHRMGGGESRIGRAKAVTATARKIAVLFYNCRAIRNGLCRSRGLVHETRYRASGFVLFPN
jgi:hypothetical protein